MSKYLEEHAERIPDNIALVGNGEGWKGRRVEGKKKRRSTRRKQIGVSERIYFHKRLDFFPVLYYIFYG